MSGPAPHQPNPNWPEDRRPAGPAQVDPKWADGPADHLAEVAPELLAAIDLWDATCHAEPMPADVLDRSRVALAGAMSPQAGTETSHTDPIPMSTRAGGQRRWSKPLAVCIVGAVAVAAAAWWATRPADLSEQRDAFIASTPGAIVAPLRMSDPGGWNCGSIAWSPDRRTTFMLATGLAVNDPAERRYTLWARSSKGVLRVASFDVTNSVDQILRLQDIPQIRGVRQFVITLDAVDPDAGVESVEVARSVAF